MTNDINQAAVLAVLTKKDQEFAPKYLRALVEAIENESILNVDLQDIKFHLNRYVDTAYDLVREGTPYEVTYPYGLVMSAHDVISLSKKVAKMNPTGVFGERVRAFCAAILPVAKAMAALKPFVVKGRRPPTAEQVAAKAAKLANVKSMARAQCGCCFAEQAMFEDGSMHDHGYRKPRAWMKSGSCRGWGVQALHLSNQGPKLMVEMLNATEKHLLAGIESLRAATKLSVQRGHEVKNGIRVPKYEDIEVGHPEFERVRQSRISENESHLREVRHDRAIFEKVVAEWKPGYVYNG